MGKTQKNQNNFEKGKLEDFHLLYSYSYQDSVWYGHKDRHRDQ